MPLNETKVPAGKEEEEVIQYEDMSQEDIDGMEVETEAQLDTEDQHYYLGRTNQGKQMTAISDEEMEEMDFTEAEQYEAYQSETDESSMFYEKQGAWDMTARVVGGGLYKGVLSAVENTAYMLDVGEWTGLWDEADDGFTNQISEWMKEAKGYYDENDPLYSQGTGDLGWWAQGIQSTIDSGVGFAIPGGVAGKGISALVKAFGITGTTGAFVSNLSTAVMTNYAESKMMSDQIYEDAYKKLLANGFSEERAALHANNDKEDFMFANKAMILTDMAALGSFFPSSKTIAKVGMGGGKKSFGGALTKGVGKFAYQGAGEAVEEVTQDFAVKEIERDTDIELGIKSKDNTSITSRATKFVKDEGWESALWGFVGGWPQAAGATAVGGLNKAFTHPGKGPGVFKGTPPIKPTVEKPVMDAPLIFERGTKESPMKVYQKDGKQYSQKEWDAEVSRWEKENATNLGEWSEHESKVKDYNDSKSAHDKKAAEHKKTLDDFKLTKAHGTKAQASKDIKKFLETDGPLNEAYQEALIGEDFAAVEDIENERFENLFLKYVTRGYKGNDTGALDVLIDRLNAVKGDENTTAEDKAKADSLLKKIGDPNAGDGMIGEYMKVYNNVAIKSNEELGGNKKALNSVATAIFKQKMRMMNTADLITNIHDEQAKITAVHVAEMNKVEGDKNHLLNAELRDLQTEQAALHALMSSGRHNVGTEAKIAKRVAELGEAIAEKTEYINSAKKEAGGTSVYNATNDDFDNESGIKMDMLAKRRAEAYGAYYAYKSGYDLIKDGGVTSKRVQKITMENLNGAIDRMEYMNHLPGVARAIKFDHMLTDSQRESVISRYQAKANGIKVEAAQNERKIEYKKQKLVNHQTAQNNVAERIDRIVNDDEVITGGEASPLPVSEEPGEAKGGRRKKVRGSTKKKLAEKKRQNRQRIRQDVNDAEAEGPNLVLKAEAIEQQLEIHQEEFDSANALTNELNEESYASIERHNPVLGAGLRKWEKGLQLSSEEVREIAESPIVPDDIKADVMKEAKEIANTETTPTQGTGFGKIVQKHDNPDAEDHKESQAQKKAEITKKKAPNTLRYISKSYSDEGIPKKDRKVNGASGITAWLEELVKENKMDREMILSKETGKGFIKMNWFEGRIDQILGKDSKIKSKVMELSGNYDMEGLKEILKDDLESYLEIVNIIPVIMTVVGDKGKSINVKVEKGSREASAYLPSPLEGVTDDNREKAIESKVELINHIKAGKIAKVSITGISKGVGFSSSDNNAQYDPSAGLGKKNASELTLTISDGNTFYKGKKLEFDEYSNSNGTPGFLFVPVNAPDGTVQKMRLNSRRPSDIEKSAIFEMVRGLARSSGPMGEAFTFSNDVSVIGDRLSDAGVELSGMSIGDALDLLIFNGERTMDTTSGYPFFIDFATKQFHFKNANTGENMSIPLNKQSMDKNQDAIKNYLDTMYLTTNLNRMNGKMNLSDDIVWMGEKFKKDTNYNQFLFHTKTLSSNADFANPESSHFKKPFVQPVVSFGEVNFEEGKREEYTGNKQKASKKNAEEKKKKAEEDSNFNKEKVVYNGSPEYGGAYVGHDHEYFDSIVKQSTEEQIAEWIADLRSVPPKAGRDNDTIGALESLAVKEEDKHEHIRVQDENVNMIIDAPGFTYTEGDC